MTLSLLRRHFFLHFLHAPRRSSCRRVLHLTTTTRAVGSKLHLAPSHEFMAHWCSPSLCVSVSECVCVRESACVPATRSRPVTLWWQRQRERWVERKKKKNLNKSACQTACCGSLRNLLHRTSHRSAAAEEIALTHNKVERETGETAGSAHEAEAGAFPRCRHAPPHYANNTPPICLDWLT